MSAVSARGPGGYDRRSAVRHLKRADPHLARLIAQVGPCRLSLRAPRSTFHALMRAVVYQQLSGRAAAAILARLRALFPGDEEPEPQRLLALPDAALRAAGLSRNKLAALRDLAAKTLNGTVPEAGELRRMSDEAIIARLTVVRGVGRWTAEMLLIFDLGRPDVLPLDDLGIRKGFARAYAMRGLPASVTLQRAGRRWAPYRSVASWYLWRAAETPGP